jgi:hypothetical protein
VMNFYVCDLDTEHGNAREGACDLLQP